MSIARVDFFSISLDGFGTGVGQSLETPFGHAGERLHEWMFVTRRWRERAASQAAAAASTTPSMRLHDQGIGAEIMGAGKFGPPGWHQDPEWKGWWGDEPALPYAGLRPHPPPAPVDGDGGRHDLPLHRQFAGRGARNGPRGRGRPGRADRRRSHARSESSSQHGSSTTCTSWWSRSCSAGENASGTGWRASRMTSRSRRPRRQAESPI